MRALEITLAILLFTRIILPLFAKRRLVVGASIAGLLVMILHLLAEGYRWQMTPLYGLTITYGLLALSQKREQKSDNDKQSRKRIALASVGVITLGIAVMPAILLPVPRTPKPTGTFDVGTITFSLVDSSREELYGPETGSPRTISVKIWYPIDKGVETVICDRPFSFGGGRKVDIELCVAKTILILRGENVQLPGSFVSTQVVIVLDFPAELRKYRKLNLPFLFRLCPA